MQRIRVRQNLELQARSNRDTEAVAIPTLVQLAREAVRTS